MIALRTQQVIAHESGVANTIDPLGGSWYVEELTNRLEAQALDYFRRIDEMGGMVAAIEKGFPQREIMDAAYAYQRSFDKKEKLMVGVNDFVVENEKPINTLYISDAVEEEQRGTLAAVKARRDAGAVRRTLDRLKDASAKGENVMPPLVEAVTAYATVGEISDVWREVYGTYEEPAAI